MSVLGCSSPGAKCHRVMPVVDGVEEVALIP
jgi:hypothetical protein